MQAGKWEEPNLRGVLASYGRAHDPFNTTDNFDGHLTRRRNHRALWHRAVDRYSSFFLCTRTRAVYADPRPRIRSLPVRKLAEAVLYADRKRARLNPYTDEY